MRISELQTISHRFKQVLDVYPPAGDLIGDLTVEVGMDDRDAGWEVVHRVLPHLERLEVHVYGKLWNSPMWREMDLRGRPASQNTAQGPESAGTR